MCVCVVPVGEGQFGAGEAAVPTGQAAQDDFQYEVRVRVRVSGYGEGEVEVYGEGHGQG